MRLIDADALKEHYAWWYGGTAEYTLDEMKLVFDGIVGLQPTIHPVKRGKWIDHIRDYWCSECGGRIQEEQEKMFSICPYCGARMERSEDERTD